MCVLNIAVVHLCGEGLLCETAVDLFAMNLCLEPNELPINCSVYSL